MSLGEDITKYAGKLDKPYQFNGSDESGGYKGFIILLKAKPGKGEQVAAFLRDINAGVNKEPMTGPWFGNRFDKETFAIFEAFPDLAARNAHVDGPGGQNFPTRIEELEEILACPAQVYRMDVLHGKFDVFLGKKVTLG